MNKHSIGLIVSVAIGTAPWIFGTNQVSSSDETPNVNVRRVEEILGHEILNTTAKAIIARGDDADINNLIDEAEGGSGVVTHSVTDWDKAILDIFCTTGKMPVMAYNASLYPPSGKKIPLSPEVFAQLGLDLKFAPETYIHIPPEILVDNSEYTKTTDTFSMEAVLELMQHYDPWKSSGLPEKGVEEQIRSMLDRNPPPQRLQPYLAGRPLSSENDQHPSSGAQAPLLDPGWLEQLVKNNKYEFFLDVIANKQLLKDTVKRFDPLFNRSAIDWSMAPEILIDDKQRIDIYSLGVMLYLMLHCNPLESSGLPEKGIEEQIHSMLYRNPPPQRLQIYLRILAVCRPLSSENDQHPSSDDIEALSSLVGWLKPLVGEAQFNIIVSATLKYSKWLEQMARILNPNFNAEAVKRTAKGKFYGRFVKKLDEHRRKRKTNPGLVNLEAIRKELIDACSRCTQTLNAFSIMIIWHYMGQPLNPLGLPKDGIEEQINSILNENKLPEWLQPYLLILSECGVDPISIFDIENGLLGVLRDTSFLLLKHAYAGDDDLVRNLMGVAKESIEQMDHLHRTYAAQAGKEAYLNNIFRIACEMSTDDQIRRSKDLLNGKPARDVLVDGWPHRLTPQQQEHVLAVIRGWAKAKTPKERAVYIDQLAEFYADNQIPIVENPVLQRALWDLCPQVGRVGTGDYLLSDASKIPNGVDVVVISGLFASIDTIKLYNAYFNPKAIDLCDHDVSELVRAGIQFEHANALVIEYDMLELLLGSSLGEVKQCFPNLKVIDVVIPLRYPPSEDEIQDMLNELKTYGKPVNLIISQHDAVNGRKIVYVHEYSLDPQGNLVLTKRRKAIGVEHLYWTK
jgi:serine/threonine protein kinase